MAKTRIYDGDIIEQDGMSFRVNVEYDDSGESPWERSDCHGPVSDWTSRDKGPGEILLHSDGRSKRFYDFAEATKIAKREGWGLSKEAEAELAQSIGREPTRKEIAAEAVRRDYEYLRRWCTDLWSYVGVVVTHIPDDEESGDVPNDYGHALWGIESDSDDYIAEVADELMGDIVAELQAEETEREHWATRNLVTVG